MVKSKSKKCVINLFINFFKTNKGKFDKTAIVFTILNVFSSFFLLSSLFHFSVDLTNLPGLIRQGIALYVLFGISLCIFALLVMSLKDKFIKFNINLFLVFYFIFQLPTITWLKFLFFILIWVALYIYLKRQKLEIQYAKKINIYRRVSSGLYLIVFISVLAMSINSTSSFTKNEINNVIDEFFIEDGQVKNYMVNVYDEYLNDEKFYKEVSSVENTILTMPEKILETLKTLPPETLGLISPEAATMLQGDGAKDKLDELRQQVMWSIDQIKNNVSNRELLIDRIINVAVSKIKGVTDSYTLYIRFYYGYSIFACLIIVSPFLMLFIKWSCVFAFAILKKSKVIKIVTEKQAVEVIQV